LKKRFITDRNGVLQKASGILSVLIVMPDESGHPYSEGMSIVCYE